MSKPDTPLGKSTSGRFGFVDLLRGFALVVMIETHVINAYLPHASRHTWFFFWLTFINGLVAPTFLFASGFSIILQADRQWDAWIHFRPPLWRQMRRLGFITLVAYYSHIGTFKLSHYIHNNDPGLWRETLQVDVLQCIVASLLVIHALVFILRERSRVAWGCVVLSFAVVLFTPWMWARDFTDHLPLAAALFLNPHKISLFPLFPWMSFLLAGSCACYFFLKSTSEGRQGLCMRNAAILGAAMMVGCFFAQKLPWTLPGVVNFFTTSPLYVGIRLGCVLLVGVLLYYWERGSLWIPKPVRVAGQESLLVYGVHLWVIFGFLRGKHLGPILGLEMGYPACFLLSAAIIAAMLALAALWHRSKREYPRTTKTAQVIAVLVMIVVFLLR